MAESLGLGPPALGVSASSFTQKKPADSSKSRTPVHSTISKDHSGGEDERRISTLMHFGRRIQRSARQSQPPLAARGSRSLQSSEVGIGTLGERANEESDMNHPVSLTEDDARHTREDEDITSETRRTGRAGHSSIPRLKKRNNSHGNDSLGNDSDGNNSPSPSSASAIARHFEQLSREFDQERHRVDRRQSSVASSMTHQGKSPAPRHSPNWPLEPRLRSPAAASDGAIIAPPSPTAAADSRGNIDLLLNNAAEIDSLQGTLLHVAAEKGHTEIVKLLLARGATIDGRALQGTLLQGHSEVAKLLDRGATIDGALQAPEEPGLDEAVEIFHNDEASGNSHTKNPMNRSRRYVLRKDSMPQKMLQLRQRNQASSGGALSVPAKEPKKDESFV